MLIIYLTIICVLYAALILFFKKGWNKISFFLNRSNTGQQLPSVSIVVAAKNEETNLLNLLQSLKNQSDSNFELILINDGSTDRTIEVMHRCSSCFTATILNNCQSEGKKRSVQQGIMAAKSELILTTDADCIPDEKWVETVRHFQADNDCDLIILPVLMSASNSWFSHIQQLEFATLVASGAGAAGNGSPFLCNAANLAFKKSAYKRAQADLHFEKQSGDDIFLLESVKKSGGKIRFLKSGNAAVQTTACANIQEFFRQRKRWAGKATAYSDKLLILTALTVLLISMSEIALLVLGVFFGKYLIACISVFFLKYAVDLIFIQKVKAFFKLKHTIRNSILLSIIYPLYICVTGIAGIFSKNVKWK
ncbi:MAG: glycosyltransferase [Prevotellaceae bacterium]|jgi:cellulose synthase/poly-beta-1,6-N-acetylglucosamine synthase-like glycosyltransferase|nr:glycosyltransferase [Prevotellaceae bacterium]